jgi:hypothetical protein
VNYTFSEGHILLPLASQMPLSAAGFAVVYCEDSGALPDDYLSFQLLCLSLSRLPVFLVVKIENPCNLLLTSPDVTSNNIVGRTSA